MIQFYNKFFFYFISFHLPPSLPFPLFLSLWWGCLTVLLRMVSNFLGSSNYSVPVFWMLKLQCVLACPDMAWFFLKLKCNLLLCFCVYMICPHVWTCMCVWMYVCVNMCVCMLGVHGHVPWCACGTHRALFGFLSGLCSKYFYILSHLVAPHFNF